MNEIPTPRSDSMEQLLGRHSSTRTMLKEACEFARTLERELTAVREKLEATEKERDGLDEDVSAQRTEITERDAKIRAVSAELSRLRAECAAKDAALYTIQAQCREIASLIVGNSGAEPNVNERCALNLLHSICAPPVCVPVEVVAKPCCPVCGNTALIPGASYCNGPKCGAALDAPLAPDLDADAEGMNHELFQLRGVVANQSKEITQLREMLETTLEAAAKACDENAERLAEDMDHRNKDHAKWWKRVQEMRALIRLAAPVLAKGDK